MRRGTILVLGLLLACPAMPQNADARPLILKVLRGMTAPFGLMGHRRHASRRAHHPRRAVASRRARPAVIAVAPAAAIAGAATAAAVAAPSATANTNMAETPAYAAPTTATQPTQATGADPAAAQAAVPATTGIAGDATAAVPIPSPAPPQRNAALAGPADEPQGRAGEPIRAPAPQQQSRLGTVGPLVWPTAYEDVIGFTLWPKEYGERLRAHGISDVLGTALLPSATLAARTRAQNVQARADEPGNAPMTAACGSIDLTSADWPIATITSAIELNAAQRGSLDRLKTAMSDAISSIKSSCRGDEANLTPVERLRAMQNTLWAVHDAAQLIREPLAKFYDSLTQQQKQQFAAPASQQADPRAMSRVDMARMCGSPASNEAPMRQIEQSLRPTKAQRASLDALQKRSFEMAQFLMASCLKPIPATPTERLDAASDRLTAVIFAASNINMALNDFTSQLSDEQKAKLNSLR